MGAYLKLIAIEEKNLLSKDSEILLPMFTRLDPGQDYDVMSQIGGYEGYFQDYAPPVVPVHELPTGKSSLTTARKARKFSSKATTRR